MGKLYWIKFNSLVWIKKQKQKQNKKTKQQPRVDSWHFRFLCKYIRRPENRPAKRCILGTRNLQNFLLRCVVQDRMNGAPNETRIHSWTFSGLAC